MPTRSHIQFVFVGLLCCGAGIARAQTPPGPSIDDIRKQQQLLEQMPTDPADVLAVVGETKILLGDVKPRVDALIKGVLAKAGQTLPPEQMKVVQLNLTRRELVQAIRNKAMRESFLLEQVGTQGADKRREVSEMMSSRARQMFHETKVPELIKTHKAKNLVDLDDKLREQGTSVAANERDFMDAMLGHMYMRSAVEQEPHVTLAEINNYYVTNQKEFSHKSKAKWEQLSVLFSNHSREEADKLIREIGREAYFGGNVQAVARNRSEEPFASDGGLHDWTSKGSLASKVLDQQIFSLPLNRLSDVIEDESGFHIIRILDRKAAGVQQIGEVQEEIRKKIQQTKVAKAQEKMLQELMARVPVWSLFPEDWPGATPLRVQRIATRPGTTLPNAKNY